MTLPGPEGGEEIAGGGRPGRRPEAKMRIERSSFFFFRHPLLLVCVGVTYSILGRYSIGGDITKCAIKTLRGGIAA